MDIANDFFRSSTTLPGLSMEETINFFIDHYFEIISRYREMKRQNDDLLEQKKEAKKALDSLRKEKKQIRLSKRQLSHAEKVEIAQRETLYKNIIKSTEPAVDENGEPIEYDRITQIIMNHKRMFEKIDIMDEKSREGLGHIAKKGTSVATWPLRKMITEASIITDDPRVEEILEGALVIVDRIPDGIKSIFK